MFINLHVYIFALNKKNKKYRITSKKIVKYSDEYVGCTVCGQLHKEGSSVFLVKGSEIWITECEIIGFSLKEKCDKLLKIK